MAAAGGGGDLCSERAVSRQLARMNMVRAEQSLGGEGDAPRRVPLFFATILVSFYVGYFGAERASCL